MRSIILLLGILLYVNFSWAQCNNIPIDLNTWTAQGGTWNVSGSGTSVFQTVNGPNVYFLSPQPFINVIISGTLRTDDADDDNMGFVFGVEGTIDTSPFHYYRFEWDEGGNGNGMYVREYDQTGLVATHLSLVGNHWTRGMNHNFTLTYQSSKIIITMDGTQVLEMDGCFNPGKFGFFNRSQANVTYSNFQYLPTPDFQFVSNDSICITEPAITDIFCVSSNTNPYAEIRWDFGDGTIISNVTNASHNYAAAGTYNLELYVRDFFGCEDSITKQIRIFDPSFTLGPDQSICPGAFNATFTSSNTNPGNTYLWSSGETTPNITKNTTAEYRLTLTDANGCIARDTVNLSVGVLPTVSYTANSECIYDNVVFTNTTNSTQSVFWDFGDGNTSNAANPSHQYAASGNYTTKLVATFGQGCKDSTTLAIDIFDAPQANFTGNDDCFNNTAIFTNTSSINTGTITNNIWSFGDGGTGNQLNESHDYATAGNYTVELVTVSNNLCYDTVSYSFDRHAIPNMAYNFSNACLYDSILFTNNSTVDMPSVFQSYEWFFGDGNTSANNSPYHKYSNYGNYTTKLIGTTQFGCQDSLTQSITIHPTPSAEFSFVNDCYNVLANFTDQSTIGNGTITDWNWSFGDGLTGNLDNETHLYNTDGNFVVELVVSSDNSCTDTVTHTITRFPLPIPAYTANSECVYDQVQFNDVSTINAPDNITTWEWSFGPGLNANQQSPNILFPSAGSNPVKLVLTSNNGCKDSISSTIDIYAQPNANFITNDDCNNIPATFIDNSSVVDGIITNWEWDLDDGTSSTNQNLTHYYQTPGTYTIELIVTSSNLCKDTLTQQLVRHPIPTASFNFQNECQYDALTFTNQSSITNGNTIIDYSWDFGDGSNLNQNEHPTHFFSNSGLYEVQLTITSDNNCIDDTTVYVEVYAVPQVNFLAQDQCINVGESNFTNVSTINSGGFNEWKWNFGDGAIDNVLHANHQYNSSGNYTVELIGISNNGCSDTITKPVTIYNKPTASMFINKTEDCVPVCFYFADLSTDDNGISFWEWEFENHEASIQQHPSICIEEAGEYDVSLIVTNIYNCKDTIIETDLLKARPNPIADFTMSTQLTDILNPFLSFTNNSFDAQTWKWDLGDGTIDAANYDTENTYNNAGVYPIQLYVENQYGCNDSLTKDLTVRSKAFHYLPNSFTPNGDGINDAFKVQEESLNFESLSVYDRWGKPVFYSEDILQEWNGTTNGIASKGGTYVWILRYIDEFDNNQIEKGSVTLIK
ncbi:MAG: PKD domain-containing protein [Flavobacteriales bacterium]|jgi:gliding motility-associated-like protein|nr:PKD domain-containing protein [Flavobacteriales bacterium]